eukprot:6172210-Pleurochrysis_carterae.AAC.5
MGATHEQREVMCDVESRAVLMARQQTCPDTRVSCNTQELIPMRNGNGARRESTHASSLMCHS